MRRLEDELRPSTPSASSRTTLALHSKSPSPFGRLRAILRGDEKRSGSYILLGASGCHAEEGVNHMLMHPDGRTTEGSLRTLQAMAQLRWLQVHSTQLAHELSMNLLRGPSSNDHLLRR